MSGLIWGAIEFHKASSNKAYGEDIIPSFRRYRIDEFHTQIVNNAVFGAGVIYVNQKEEYQKNPYYDQKEQIFIVIDSIIDNRQELISTLSLDKSVSDTQIVLKAYQIWGSLVAEHIYGDFAFVIYDIKNNKVLATRDHLGQRSLYYYKDKDIFMFSTTIGGINAMRGRCDMNEEWFSQYLTLPLLIPEVGCRATPIKDIYQLPFARSLLLTSEKSKVIRFWNPLKDVKQIRYEKDEDYLHKFNEIFHQAVACRLSTVGETGILLSGGLDSTAVAAESAQALKECDRKLYAFSYIPVDEFKYEEKKTEIYSEKNYVEALCKRWDNIQICYIQSTSQNALTEMESFIDMLELPFKCFDNIMWIHESYRRAIDNNCRIILSGKFGNSTISKGSRFSYLNMLLKHGRLLKAKKEVQATAELYNVSENKIWRMFIDTKLDDIRNLRLKGKKDYRIKLLESLPIKQSLLHKYRTLSNAQKVGLYSRFSPFFSIKEEKKLNQDELLLSTLGVYETKQTLAEGIICRDPTRDIRLIEYTLAIPYNQYVCNGSNRNLIRRAMKDKVPDLIRLNYTKRGVQGADWKYLFQIKKFNLAEKFSEISDTKFAQIFLDGEKIKKISEKLYNDNEENDSAVRNAAMLLVAEKYFCMVFNNFE